MSNRNNTLTMHSRYTAKHKRMHRRNLGQGRTYPEQIAALLKRLRKIERSIASHKRNGLTYSAERLEQTANKIAARINQLAHLEYALKREASND